MPNKKLFGPMVYMYHVSLSKHCIIYIRYLSCTIWANGVHVPCKPFKTLYHIHTLLIMHLVYLISITIVHKIWTPYYSIFLLYPNLYKTTCTFNMALFCYLYTIQLKGPQPLLKYTGTTFWLVNLYRGYILLWTTCK